MLARVESPGNSYHRSKDMGDFRTTGIRITASGEYETGGPGCSEWNRGDHLGYTEGFGVFRQQT